MTAADLVALAKDFGFPAVLVIVLLWKVLPKLDDISRALWALVDEDKTAARFRKPLDEQAEHIIERVDHNTRAAIQPLVFRERP